MKVVIYARYSSDKQTEQSIEGQLYDCYNYAAANNIQVIGEYIDRALTGKNEDRPQFKKMLSDSESGTFNAVLVWKLDRFARNTIDSALNRLTLKNNNVKVISVMENFGDNATGDMIVHVMEAINEYYSADLREKTVRGMHQSALKCNSTGGHIPLGYKIEGKKYVIDERTRYIPETVFTMYADGYRLSDIADLLNSKGYRRKSGKPFTVNSFYNMLSNEKYIGVYTYNDVRIEGGYQTMIQPEIFEKVQERLRSNKKRTANNNTKADYLLSGKLYCGHCGQPMSGMSGHSRSGEPHFYYRCNGVKIKSGCDKKNEVKDRLEAEVIAAAREALSAFGDKEAEQVAKMFEADAQITENLETIRNELKDVEKRIENAVNAITEMGGSPALYANLKALEERKEQLQATERLNAHMADNIPSVDDVKKYFATLAEIDLNSPEGAKTLVNIMIDRVYVFDDRLRIIFTSDNNPDVEIPLKDIKDTPETSKNVFASPPQWGATSDKSEPRTWFGFFRVL